MNLLNRANRIILLIRCMIKSLFYSVADKIPKNISKVIIAPDGKLGDVVCNTPVLHAIRKHLPNAYIIVAGNSKLHRSLLSNSGLVDEYLNLKKYKIISQIKKYSADVAIITGPSFEATALFYLAGVPLVVSPQVISKVFCSEVTRPYKILQKFIKTYPHKIGVYAPRERLRSLEVLNIYSNETKKYLGFSETAGNKAIEIISKIPHTYKYLIGISAGAGNKEKQWNPKKFAEVANYFIKKYNAHIFIFGGEGDVPESNEMISAILDKSKMTDLTSISIDALKAMISKLDVFISVNTGPIYIAEAFEVSTVDLVGPVNPYDQPPQGDIHKIVFSPGKPKPLLSIMNSRNHDVKKAQYIAQSTRVKDVITATEEVLNDVDKKMAIKKE